LIDFTDFLPSLVDLSGSSLPKGFKSDGVSFAPQLLNKDGVTRDWVFSYYYRLFKKNARMSAMNKGWKVYDNGDFYNLEKDPMETKKLASMTLSPVAQTNFKKLMAVIKRMQSEKPIRNNNQTFFRDDQ
jgi:arylsulfatase A